MIETSIYQLTPYLTEGSVLQAGDINNRTYWLREAINMMMNRKKEQLVEAGVDIDLFHNHDPKSGQNKVEYPKIQYLRKQNRYFVTGIDKGGLHALEQLFIDCKPMVNIHDGLALKIEHIENTTHQVELTHGFNYYRLINWLPFGENSAKDYNAIEPLAEKVLFLEKRLTNHIVNDFCRYLKISLDNGEVKVAITKVDDYACKKVTTKENQKIKYYQPFTITFQTNLLLPGNICLGNRKAYGFGLVEAVAP
jgi:hypothetical protein